MGDKVWYYCRACLPTDDGAIYRLSDLEASHHQCEFFIHNNTHPSVDPEESPVCPIGRPAKWQYGGSD